MGMLRERINGKCLLKMVAGFVSLLVFFLSGLPCSYGYEATRLFILSGQSNMVGIDPAVSFIPTLQAAFSNDDLIVIKRALNGQLVYKWYEAWTPPPGSQAPAGWHNTNNNGSIYRDLISDTNSDLAVAMVGKPVPDTVTFVWMQGEADAGHTNFGSTYGQALAGILQQLERDLGRADIDFVLGRISDYGINRPDERPDWNIIREAQVQFATNHAQRAWVNTDDLNGSSDGLHYGSAGYATLGTRFAQAAIALIGENSPPPPLQQWQLQYFGCTNLISCPQAAGDADPDGDGMSNTNEFLAGFNPTNNAAYLHIISIVQTNGDMQVTYLGANGNPPTTSRTNVLEFTTGAPDGSFSNDFVSTGQTNILSGGTGLGVEANFLDTGGVSSMSRFYRVRVLVP